MLHFKTCPKCLTGAMYEHDGFDGLESKCVSCAYTVYLDHSIEEIVTSARKRTDSKIRA
ncbi:MAG: hypothetical protein OTJ43_07570 [Dehalococcoidia bacterium]|nr:hypothetical protein [Dehalococcoidia bacterium]